MTLTDVRESLGLSQIEVDRRASLSKGTVADIERGRNQNPSVLVCLAIVDVFRRAGAKAVTVESLFAETKAGAGR